MSADRVDRSRIDTTRLRKREPSHSKSCRNLAERCLIRVRIEVCRARIDSIV